MVKNESHNSVILITKKNELLLFLFLFSFLFFRNNSFNSYVFLHWFS